jgi:exodeoxyribonuclease V alpha subunit
LQQVRSHFGDDEFLKALTDAKRLEEIPAISSFVALHITQRWEVVQAYFRALVFMGDLGLPPSKISQVWAMFGDDAEKILSSNPWELVRVDGVTFQQADEIAMKLGLDMTDPNRLRGAVIYASKNQRSFGHLYMTTGQLLSEVQSILRVEVPTGDFAKVLAESHRDKALVVDREARPEVRAIYDPWSWQLEKDSSDILSKRVQTAAFTGDSCKTYIKLLGSVGVKTEAESKVDPPNLAKVVETAVDEWGTASKLVLSVAQRQGVINALSSPVSILTGLPGTGKTTCLTAVVSILKDMSIPYLLCAPTGIAAKNLGAKTHASASTIHRAFAAQGRYGSRRDSTYVGVVGDVDGPSGSEKDESWGYDQSSPYPAKVVICDETSMLDQHLIYRLLACTSDDCRLVIVGDAAQLPSVGPGNVLRDMINSNQFPVVHLTEIFRQKDTSGIVYAAHSIHRGEMPDTEMTDFRLLPLQGDEKVSEAIIKIAVKLHAAHTNFQILSPRHGGAVGVTTLNAKMRELLNPGGQGSQEINVGDSTIREGDRVMVVKNDYGLGVFNGDVGTVARIDRKAKEVEVKVYGDPDMMVKVPFKNAGGLLRLAYACTVHKCQGLEYDVIVMPVVESFRHQLQRNLLYTAVTRARKRVILVGSMAALGQAVVNDREDQRNTLFKYRLMSWEPVGPTSVICV